jgi:hypothetical protein
MALTEKQRKLVIKEAITSSKIPKDAPFYYVWFDPDKTPDEKKWYDICSKCFKDYASHMDADNPKKINEFQKHKEASILYQSILRILML